MKVSAGGAALLGGGGHAVQASRAEAVEVPRRKFGRHADMLSVIGIGGQTLYQAGSQAEADAAAQRALDLGVNFFENSWDYHGGEAEEYMGKALRGRRDGVFLMTKFCIYHNGRYGDDKAGALKMLEDSLRRLQTDHLDLWMLHNIKGDDARRAYEPEGAVAALEQARKDGKIRHVGFTGHTTPQVHLDIIDGGFEWDATLMPVSVVGALSSRGFEREVMPKCVEKNIAVLGMKGFGGSRRTHLHGRTSASEVVRYSLSYPQVCTHVIGIDKPEFVDAAVLASAETPMDAGERGRFAVDDAPGSPDHLAMRHGGGHYEGGCTG